MEWEFALSLTALVIALFVLMFNLGIYLSRK